MAEEQHKPQDVFGRKDPNFFWEDVPKEHFDALMAMSEKDRNKVLKKIEESPEYLKADQDKINEYLRVLRVDQDKISEGQDARD